MLKYLIGRQKLLKLSLQTFLFCVDFWEFCFISHFQSYFDLKSIGCSISFCQKKWQSIWQERVAVYEGWKGMISCMLYPWYILLNSIIHWIAWTRSKYMKWWSNPFNKGGILASNRLNVLPIFLYWVQKSRVEKDNNSQLLLSCHAIQVWIFQ